MFLLITLQIFLLLCNLSSSLFASALIEVKSVRLFQLVRVNLSWHRPSDPFTFGWSILWHFCSLDRPHVYQYMDWGNEMIFHICWNLEETTTHTYTLLYASSFLALYTGLVQIWFGSCFSLFWVEALKLKLTFNFYMTDEAWLS